MGSAIWLFDLTRGTALRFTLHPGVIGFPVWSPDSSRIVYTSNLENSLTLYQKAASGSGTEEKMLRTKNAISRDWSPDGRFIVYEERGSRPALWIMPLQGDRTPFPLQQTEFSEHTPAISPDGVWMAYASDESGRVEVYIRGFTGTPNAAASGGKWLISTRGGFSPRWRRDGNELFYLSLDGKLMAVEIKSGAKFEAGLPKLLFDTHAPYTSYDVSADGQRFIVVTPVEQAHVPSPITVVLNWQAGLKP